MVGLLEITINSVQHHFLYPLIQTKPLSINGQFSTCLSYAIVYILLPATIPNEWWVA